MQKCGGDFIAHMSMREAILMTVNIDILVPMTEADLDFQSQRWERVGTAADRLIAENLEAFQELAK